MATRLPTVSLQARMLLTIVVGLLALVVTHVGLSWLYATTSLGNVRDRLEDMSVSLSKVITTDPSGQVHVDPLDLPDAKLRQGNSGLYAVIMQDDVVVWKSPSVGTGGVPALPQPTALRKGPGVFAAADSTTTPVRTFNKFRYPVLVPDPKAPQKEKVLSIMVYEDGAVTAARMEVFRSAIWLALLLSFVMLATAQTIIARWSLRPLLQLMKELSEVKTGSKTAISGNYPKELSGITQGLNTLLAHELDQRQAYQHALSNLAHSLKTPLAVLQSNLDSPNPSTLLNDVQAQVNRMNEMVSYQLSIASRSGRSTFAQPEPLEPLAMGIIQSLEKIHASKGALCECDWTPNVMYPANKGDLQELLGNMLENAFKWCRSRVLLRIHPDPQRQVLMIAVEDDGPGVPPDRINDIVSRGVRVDERVQGHGIGLAIVEDIVRTYKGQLTIGVSEEHGGAKFVVTLPMSSTAKPQ